MSKTTKIIVAGGRDFDDYDMLYKKLNHLLRVYDEYWFLPDLTTIELVSGGAKGADKLGEEFAEEELCVHSKVFPADWNKHGKAAGPKRNEQMAKYADVCICFWNGESKGTKNMIDNALKYGLELHVFRYDKK